MTPSFLRKIGLSSFLLSLCACSTSAPSGKDDAWTTATRGMYDRLQDAGSLQGVTIPVLKAPGLARVWGAPKVKLDGAGGYELIYSDPKQPFTRLMIYGMTSPLPSLSKPPMLGGEEMVNDQLTGFDRPQEWRQLTVAGTKVRWFQESTSGGADGAYYSTEGFKLTGPDGKAGYYRLQAEAGDEPETPARWFSSVALGE